MEDKRQQVLPKWWYLSTKLYDVMSQKTVILILAAVRTLNLMQLLLDQAFTYVFVVIILEH